MFVSDPSGLIICSYLIMFSLQGMPEAWSNLLTQSTITREEYQKNPQAVLEALDFYSDQQKEQKPQQPVMQMRSSQAPSSTGAVAGWSSLEPDETLRSRPLDLGNHPPPYVTSPAPVGSRADVAQLPPTYNAPVYPDPVREETVIDAVAKMRDEEKRLSTMLSPQLMDQLRSMVTQDDPRRLYTKIKKIGQG